MGALRCTSRDPKRESPDAQQGRSHLGSQASDVVSENHTSKSLSGGGRFNISPEDDRINAKHQGLLPYPPVNTRLSACDSEPLLPTPARVQSTLPCRCWAAAKTEGLQTQVLNIHASWWSRSCLSNKTRRLLVLSSGPEVELIAYKSGCNRTKVRSHKQEHTQT